MMHETILLANETAAWFSNPGTVGGLIGAGVGVFGGAIYGPLVGVCARSGRAKPLVLAYHWALLLTGIALLGAGIGGLISGQPYGVWYSLLLPGALLTGLMTLFTPLILRVYRQAEQRRLEAEEFRRA